MRLVKNEKKKKEIEFFPALDTAVSPLQDKDRQQIRFPIASTLFSFLSAQRNQTVGNRIQSITWSEVREFRRGEKNKTKNQMKIKREKNPARKADHVPWRLHYLSGGSSSLYSIVPPVSLSQYFPCWFFFSSPSCVLFSLGFYFCFFLTPKSLFSFSLCVAWGQSNMQTRPQHLSIDSNPQPLSLRPACNCYSSSNVE